MELHPFWKEYPSLQSDLDKVSIHIQNVVEASPSAIRDDLGRLLLNRGKMLRPAFVLLSSGWGDKNDNIYALAAAVELLHTSSLIHDDVLDNALARRGVATLHTSMGVKKSHSDGRYL